jgi:hypothetical protein
MKTFFFILFIQIIAFVSLIVLKETYIVLVYLITMIIIDSVSYIFLRKIEQHIEELEQRVKRKNRNV